MRAPRAGRLFAVGLVCAALALCRVGGAVAADISDPSAYREAQDYLLLLVNEERSFAKLPPLREDPVAAQAGKLHAEEMLAGGYFSHWDRQGLKPTRRYNLQGGYHALAENVYFYSGPEGTTRELLEQAMKTLMASEGHRRAILGPHYTHLGVGLAMGESGREMYIAQEFTTQIGGEYSCPLTAHVGDRVDFSGRFDPHVYDFAQISVAWERLPTPRDRGWLTRSGSYGDGDVMFAGLTPDPRMSFPGMSTSHDVELDSNGGWFRCTAQLDYRGREGTYYLMLWLKDKRTGDPVLAATASVEVRKS